MPSKFPCVEQFLSDVYELPPTEREEALAEVAEFCRGYIGAKEEMWKERLAVDGETGPGTGKVMPS